MMKSALQTIASVSATCRPIRIIATLLRISAEENRTDFHGDLLKTFNCAAGWTRHARQVG